MAETISAGSNLEEDLLGLMVSEVSFHGWLAPLIWNGYEAECYGQR